MFLFGEIWNIFNMSIANFKMIVTEPPQNFYSGGGMCVPLIKK